MHASKLLHSDILPQEVSNDYHIQKFSAEPNLVGATWENVVGSPSHPLAHVHTCHSCALLGTLLFGLKSSGKVSQRCHLTLNILITLHTPTLPLISGIYILIILHKALPFGGKPFFQICTPSLTTKWCIFG